MASSALLAVMACALAQPALGPERERGLPALVGVSAQVKLPALGSNGALYLAAWVNPELGTLLAARISQEGVVLDVPPLALGSAAGLQQLSVAAAPGGDFLVAFDAARDGGTDLVLLRVGAVDARVVALPLPVSPGASARSTPALARAPQGLLLALRTRVAPFNREQLQVLRLGPDGTPTAALEDVGDAGNGFGFYVQLFIGVSGAQQVALCDPLRGFPMPQPLLRFDYPGLAPLPPLALASRFPATALAGVPTGYLVYTYRTESGDTSYFLEHVDRDGGLALVAADPNFGEPGVLAPSEGFTYLFQGAGWATVVGTTLQPQSGTLFAPGQFAQAAAVCGEQALALSQRRAGTGALEGRQVLPTGPVDGGPFPIATAPSRMGEPAAAGFGGTRLHVWTEERGESGTDLYGALEPGADGGVGAPMLLCAGESDEAMPAVAADETGFRVAFVSRPSSFTSGQVRLQRVWADGGLDAPCGVALDGGSASVDLAVAASGGRTLLSWRRFFREPLSAAVVEADGGVDGPLPLLVTGGFGGAVGGDRAGWFLAWATNTQQPVAMRWAGGLPPADGGVEPLSRGLNAQGLRALISGGRRALAWLERESPGGDLDVAYQVLEGAGPFAANAQRMGAPGPSASVELAGIGGRFFAVSGAPTDAGTLGLRWLELSQAQSPSAPWVSLPATGGRFAFAVDEGGGALDWVRREPLNGSPRVLSQAFGWAQPGASCGAGAVCGAGVCSAGRCCDRPCALECSTGRCTDGARDGGPPPDGGSADAGAAIGPFGYPSGCGAAVSLAPGAALALALHLWARRGRRRHDARGR